MKLNLKSFSLTCGILWSVGLFLSTWWVIAFDGASHEMTFIGRFYRGYTFSPIGSIIGFIWGLCDGLIGGFIFAWLYNKILSFSSQEA